MKRSKRASKSIYRAILGVQKQRDEQSGLWVYDRYYEPAGNPGRHGFLWWCMDLCLLLCLAGGEFLLITTGFSTAVSGWFYPALFLIAAAVVTVFHSRLCRRFPIPAALVILIAWLFWLFMNQDAFLSGFDRMDSLVAYTLQVTYSAENTMSYPGSGGTEIQLFLLGISVPVMFWLGWSFFAGSMPMMSCLVIVPLTALAVLCGAAKNAAALFLILFGLLMAIAFASPKRQKRMWGGNNAELVSKNRLRFQSVQKKTAGIILAACLCFSVPGFFVIRPFLASELAPVEQLSLELQSSVLNRVMKLLPQLSAGRWKLNLEAVGGGVQNGALTNTSGYLLEGVEDLRLTLSRRPTETLFLRGFVGMDYADGSWTSGTGAPFDGAAMNWNTEGPSRIYVQNLPFLRTAYAISAGGTYSEDFALLQTQPYELLVERLNANDKYTYVPYGVYLNNYYQVESGDGTVTGQTAQQDRYLFFSREDMNSVLNAWTVLDSTASVLDRTEESYRAYCQVNNLAYPQSLSELKSRVDALVKENRWKPTENLNDISVWIRQYLAQNYHYVQVPADVPEGRDALEYFLLESHAGNSVHFASAAVMLYRMFGIPARYIVGYEIPASLFSAQQGGVFTATVRSDNSQAWAEIYIPGIGWEPRDMTPGVIGTYEEIGPGGERIEAAVADETSDETHESLPLTEIPTESQEADTSELPGNTEITIWQVIRRIMLALGLLLAIFLPVTAAATMIRSLGLTLFPERNTNKRLLGIFRAFYKRMRTLGLSKEIDSQSEQFAEFCETALRLRDYTTAEAFRPALQKLYRCIYGGATAAESDVRIFRKLLLTAWKFPKRNKQNNG